MNIHEHDDYEKLAKLFYPSIEASGNVYYGQTRKLTMDEILGKNDMGFESHIESEKQDSNYCKFFNWKIGPLHGAVRVGDLETFPLAYAKYKLVITNRTVENHLNSASFPTYENEIACIFDSIAYTTGNPVDESESWDGRHFYVDDSGTDRYLYIALVDYYSNEEFSDPLHTPLCITNISDSDGSFQLENNNVNNAHYFISYGDGKWYTLELNIDHSVDQHTSVYIKGHRDSYSDINCRLSLSTTFSCALSGNINSLLDEYRYSEIDDLSVDKTPTGYDIGNYTFSTLFNGASSIRFAHDLLLPAMRLTSDCYYKMFMQSGIETAPELPALYLATSCYNSMFSECGALKTAIDLPALNLADYCYSSMFSGCTNIKIISCAAITVTNSSTNEWLIDNYNNGVLLCNDIFEHDSYSGVPSGWTVFPYDQTTFPLTFVAINGDCEIVAETNPDVPGEPELYAKWPNDGWGGFGQSVWISSGNTNRNYAQIKSALNQPVTLSECHFYFKDASVSCEVAAIGNINSIIDPINYANVDTLPPQSPTRGINSEDIYPNRIGLFQFISNYNGDNTSDVLITAPALPAVKLSPSCYSKMFYNCDNLIQPPKLPATDLSTECYMGMFSRCTSLAKAPELPSTNLADNCYNGMFSLCGLLTKAPELPARILYKECYENMFYKCTSITKAPILKAHTLNQQCYASMFRDCSNLQNVEILASDISAVYSLDSWLDGVSSTGTLYYNSKADDVSTFNIPSGWASVDLYEEIKEGEEDEERTSVYRSQYMITSGSDSDQNGKGKLDGDGDYESSFDVNDNHPMGSYNPDGSYNQEIWGYKSFNSPVQFRNGIYGDNNGIYIAGEITANSITVTTLNAHNIDFDDVSDRIVTTYSKNNPSAGIDQTILGVKTFSDGISSPNISCNGLTASSISPSANVNLSNIGSSSNSYTTLYTNVTYTHYISSYGDHSNVKLSNNLIPESTAVTLGNTNNYWEHVYLKEINLPENVSINVQSSNKLKVSNANVESNWLYATDGLQVGARNDGATTWVYGPVTVFGSYVWADSFTAQATDYSSPSGKSGDSIDYHYSGIKWINPSYDTDSGTLKLKSGSIIYAYTDDNFKAVIHDAFSSTILDVGKDFTLSSQHTIYVAKLNGTTGLYERSDKTLPSGYYVSLVDWEYGSPSNTPTAIPLQCRGIIS